MIGFDVSEDGKTLEPKKAPQREETAATRIQVIYFSLLKIIHANYNLIGSISTVSSKGIIQVTTGT